MNETMALKYLSDKYGVSGQQMKRFLSDRVGLDRNEPIEEEELSDTLGDIEIRKVKDLRRVLSGLSGELPVYVAVASPVQGGQFPDFAEVVRYHGSIIIW